MVVLGLDELEALRLSDLEGLYHEAAAERMGVSRATFGRILASARRKVAHALLQQHVLVVEEGPIVEEGAPPAFGGERRCGRRRAWCDEYSESSRKTTTKSKKQGGSD